ncbi:PBECR4 domain-containing protein [Streptococcus dysgalactiae]|uniref:PBECR4 domain-containing protein n=1 Tax=Streptococcus dysgalactiae TaxID=1334 RepID=UPI0035CEBA89
MKKTINELRKTSILDVANDLGMTLKKSSGHEYFWEEHDSLKISPQKNTFSWYSKDIRGDVFTLIQTVKEEMTGKKVSFREAKNYLETGEFKQFEAKEVLREPFSYYLNSYEVADFKEARTYLRDERGLSDSTIDFFLEKGVLAEAKHRTGKFIEPVIVFKTLDSQRQITGGSLQGIRYNSSVHDRGRLKRLMKASDGLSGMHVDIGNPNRLVVSEAPIDLMSYYELHKDKLKDVRLLAMDGLKQATIGRHLAEVEALIAARPIPWTVQELGQSLSMALEEGYFQREGNQNKITLAVDNDKAGRKFIKKLQDMGITLQVDIPHIQDGEKKADWNDALKKLKKENKMIENKKNVPDPSQERFAENNVGDLPDKSQEATPLPDAKNSHLLNDLSPNQTQSQPLLHFSTVEPTKSIYKQNYHPISEKELRKLNRYAPQLQSVAQWYQNELTDRKVYYFYQDKGEVKSLEIQFQKRNFMHLTGIFPIKDGQTSEKTLEDFIHGQGIYDNILISNSGATFEKLQVLPDLKAIVDSSSFLFDDLSSIPKFHNINTTTAIRTDDKDLLVAFRTEDGVTFPASLLRLKKKLNLELDTQADEKVILGVLSQSSSGVKIHSINQEYITDNGKEFETILENNELEPILETERQEEILQEKAPSNLVSDLDLSEESIADLIAQKDTKGLSKHFKEGVKTYLNSKNYKTFLKAMSHFHKYSPRNIQLILAQNPKATHIASFKNWKENFDRTVIKGEKSLRIFAPMQIKQRDPETGKLLLDKDGKEQTRTIFKLVPVFDVSQTQGKELPKQVYEIEGKHEDYQNIYRATKAFAQTKGVTLAFDKNLTTSNGYYSPKDKSIVIKAGMSPQHTLKTIFHELAHMDLKHDPKNTNIRHAELQAESVAYVVANHFGFDTSDYSFGYLASWSEDKDTLEVLENQLVIVQKEAKELIQKLDDSLEQALSKSPKENSFENKLRHMKEVSLEKEKKHKKEVDTSKKQENDKEKTK